MSLGFWRKNSGQSYCKIFILLYDIWYTYTSEIMLDEKGESWKFLLDLSKPYIMTAKDTFLAKLLETSFKKRMMIWKVKPPFSTIFPKDFEFLIGIGPGYFKNNADVCITQTPPPSSLQTSAIGYPLHPKNCGQPQRQCGLLPKR